MSELFMECEEEELEPWQKPAPVVHVIDDDDDEPIFVGVLTNNNKPNPQPSQTNTTRKTEIKRTPPGTGASPVLPLRITGNTVKTAAPKPISLAPRPIIVNNKGYIVPSPLISDSEFIASIGKQLPTGGSLTIVPAGQQHNVQQGTQGTPGAIHRPQVHQISNNIVKLSNVQSPVGSTTKTFMLQDNNASSLQTIPAPLASNNRDQSAEKRGLLQEHENSEAKKAKLDSEQAKVTDLVENAILMKKCPKCNEEFLLSETLKSHMMTCCVSAESLNSGTSKLVMLVSEFYYGTFEGNMEGRKTEPNCTFKCTCCYKVLKNNIRFMNHMKHHLELEKQNSESWDSHTTCQHCYRQYMTPFQLQCHIESAHSPIESSTNCKICELAFESEQVLLEHMKNIHKPGEMPYICQVCSFRSSFFSVMEQHFRTVHDSTKDLLCPFCLRVLRSSHRYMQHYMKHQKKGIHRCGKCRLNFLSCKEKLDHRTHGHKTFRKPKALEGLAPGTKVTIRASLTGKSPNMPNRPARTGIVLKSDVLFAGQEAAQVMAPKSSMSAVGKVKSVQNKKQAGISNKFNVALTHLSGTDGCFTCVECNSKVEDFFSHFPMNSSCGACKYRTSCKVSYGNHMIRFHSTISKNRISKMNPKKPSAVKLTLVCTNCDLILDASGGDLMTKHLVDRPSHECRAILDKDVREKNRDSFNGQDPGVSSHSEPDNNNDLTPKEIDPERSESVPLDTNDNSAPLPKQGQEHDVTEAPATEEKESPHSLDEAPGDKEKPSDGSEVKEESCISDAGQQVQEQQPSDI
ncbi:zinc finger protein 280C isoform X1 [Synchiropus splendidus]|uniref:zinc finger protein 280C isoform X1 n=1 Tax=Synchiropus splendidus TaxID=270530 RepID=UPI00237E2142|nr:zinc finger protein 280C isoform X1 [Synchiropus splendidus]XP_053720266.1 zinc finger protein 280C isoform X1 [Synchiropus splendidus]